MIVKYVSWYGEPIYGFVVEELNYHYYTIILTKNTKWSVGDYTVIAKNVCILI